jgi:TPR repeat protein
MLFRQAAEQGYAPAQYNLGYCYEHALGVQRKLNDMLKWYRAAADNGVNKAIIALLKLEGNW